MSECHPASHIIFSPPVDLDSSWLWRPLVLMTLTVLRSTGQRFCRLPLCLMFFCGVSYVFLMLNLGLRIWGWRSQRWHALLISGTHQHNLWLLTLVASLKPHLSGFSHSFFPHFPYCILWKEITMLPPKERGAVFHFLRMQSIYINSWNSPWKMSLLPQLLFMQSFIYINMDLQILILHFKL